MTQREYRKAVRILTGIRRSLTEGVAFKRSISAKYPSEEIAREGLSVLQIANIMQLSSDIEDLWRDQQ